MRMFSLLLLILLAACGRPLSESEELFLSAIHGDQLDTTRMRLHQGHFAGSLTVTIPVRPRTTCQERLWPPVIKDRTVEVSPAASVVFNTILLRDDVYREDFMQGFPERIDLIDAMLLAHEATHVWQWQNRARTGYHPLRGLAEHMRTADPYLFDPDGPGDFLAFGYEQQGAIVEEYVCCRILDPDAPRTSRLRAMLAAHLPVEGLENVLTSARVRLPWDGVTLDGICRA